VINRGHQNKQVQGCQQNNGINQDRKEHEHTAQILYCTPFSLFN